MNLGAVGGGKGVFTASTRFGDVEFWNGVVFWKVEYIGFTLETRIGIEIDVCILGSTGIRRVCIGIMDLAVLMNFPSLRKFIFTPSSKRTLYSLLAFTWNWTILIGSNLIKVPSAPMPRRALSLDPHYFSRCGQDLSLVNFNKCGDEIARLSWTW